MRAPLVRMSVRLNDELLSNEDNVTVMFAVCDELNETCMMSVPTVNLLNDVLNKKLSRSSSNVTNIDVNCESTCVNAGVTQSQSAIDPVSTTDIDTDVTVMRESRDHEDNNISDESFIDVHEAIHNIRSDIGVANSRKIASKQRGETTLSSMWALAQQEKAGYFERNDLLFHKVKCFNQTSELLAWASEWF